MSDLLTPDPTRWAWALALLLAYALLCLALYQRHRRARLHAQAQAAALASGHRPILIAYASQTGQAQQLAEQCAQPLLAAGWAVTVQALNHTTPAQLQAATHALFIVSTYGEGDAPDNAALFQRQCMAQAFDLSALQYSLLALGDRHYRQFCGFGRTLDAWLHAQQAQPLHERLEADQSGNAAATLAHWQNTLAAALHLDASALANAPGAPALARSTWTLVQRQHLNPGSQGGAVFHLELATQEPNTTWESGDLVDLLPPLATEATEAQEPPAPRSYSIASIPADGRLHLLVRQTWRDDGTPGQASHWLTTGLDVGATLTLQLRAHPGFRLEGNAQRPLILIGNGTGLAGLRAHLRTRAALGQHANWLIAGERQAAHDQLYGAELHAWHATGHLQHLDWAFSRDGDAKTYVQDRLHQHANRLREWVQTRGAALYVCGSLHGMAEGVDTALRSILGSAAVDDLLQQGRYRRDVY